MRKYTAPLNTAVAARQIEELKATCLGEKAAGARMGGWSGLSLVAEKSRRDPRSRSRVLNCLGKWGILGWWDAKLFAVFEFFSVAPATLPILSLFQFFAYVN